jgi:hypothetical protein
MRYALFLALSACLEPQQIELLEQRATWDGLAIEDYSYTLTRTCFCPTTVVAPVRITVVDGVVTNAVYAAGGYDVVPGEPVGPDSEVLTIDELFDRAEVAIADAEEVELEYDATRGFPTVIDIDWIVDAIDEEELITATDFEPSAATTIPQ